MAKPKTQAQLDKAADDRLQKTYGITLVEYEKLLKAGNGVCWICGNPPGTRRLHVDHDHGWTKVRVEYEKDIDFWLARAEYNGYPYLHSSRYKFQAAQTIKRKLKRASIRGLCCHRC